MSLSRRIRWTLLQCVACGQGIESEQRSRHHDHHLCGQHLEYVCCFYSFRWLTRLTSKCIECFVFPMYPMSMLSIVALTFSGFLLNYVLFSVLINIFPHLYANSAVQLVSKSQPIDWIAKIVTNVIGTHVAGVASVTTFPTVVDFIAIVLWTISAAIIAHATRDHSCVRDKQP